VSFRIQRFADFSYLLPTPTYAFKSSTDIFTQYDNICFYKIMSSSPEFAFQVTLPPNKVRISGETKLVEDRVRTFGKGLIFSKYQGSDGPFVPVGEGLPFQRPDQMFEVAIKLAESGQIQLLSFSDRWPLEASPGYEHDLVSFLHKFPATLVWEIGTMGFFDDLAKSDYYADVLARVDHFVAVSEMIHKEALRNGVTPDKISTIYPPIDTGLFSPVEKEAKSRVRAGLNLPQNDPIGIYVGRFDSHKGIDFLVKNWGKAGNLGHLLLLGSATAEEQPYYDKLIAANPHVIYRGFVADSDLKAKYYQAADYLTFTSKSEGLSLMMMEAMSSGLPAVVYNGAVWTSGIGELFIEGETGYALNHYNASELNNAVHRIIRNRQFLSRRSREELLKLASDLPTTVARLEVLYRNLIVARQRD